MKCANINEIFCVIALVESCVTVHVAYRGIGTVEEELAQAIDYWARRWVPVDLEESVTRSQCLLNTTTVFTAIAPSSKRARADAEENPSSKDVVTAKRPQTQSSVSNSQESVSPALQIFDKRYFPYSNATVACDQFRGT